MPHSLFPLLTVGCFFIVMTANSTIETLVQMDDIDLLVTDHGVPGKDIHSIHKAFSRKGFSSRLRKILVPVASN